MTSVQTATAVYTVKQGDTLSEIGATLGIGWRKIAELNHIEDPFVIQPHQKLKLPNCMLSLVIQRGDTLSGISERLQSHADPGDRDKLSVRALQKLNRIRNADVISENDTLVYPNLNGTPG